MLRLSMVSLAVCVCVCVLGSLCVCVCFRFTVCVVKLHASSMNLRSSQLLLSFSAVLSCRL